MIYLTGDTHAEFEHRFNMDNFPEQKEMTRDDYAIICGDFGGVWDVGGESKNEKHWLDWFESRPHVLHLMRGQIFEIDGKKIFTFGGASSHDISGGILETDDPDFKKKKKALDKGNKPYRINHLTWWEQELASESEMEEGRNNLRRHDYTVDYIITHCCSTSTQMAFGGNGLYEADRQTDYLEFIKNHTNYKKWFFGHYHDNKNINEKEILIYEQMIRIS